MKRLRRIVGLCLGHVLRLIARMRTRSAESRRWRGSLTFEEPRVYYGRARVPSSTERASGGLVKLQDLGKAFPNELDRPNLLYLISSALPEHADVMVNLAKGTGAQVVVNQNGVGIPAYHGDDIELVNAPRRELLKRADWVVYQSHFCKTTSDHFLCEREKDFSILYNPVNVEAFKPFEAVKDIKKPVLLIGGSHHHAYRVKSALEVLGAVRGGGVNASLVVAGRLAWINDEQACRSELLKWADDLGVTGSITIMGPYTQAEAPELMGRASMLLHTKYMDPCPRLVVEAMACGLPVVYSDTGGVPELVGESAGIGVSPSDDWDVIVEMEPAKGAAAVSSILADYDSYTTNARQRAVDRFDANDWIGEHRQLFGAIMTRVRERA